MENSVKLINTVNQINNPAKAENIKTLIKYTNNEVLKEVPDTFVSTTKSTIPMVGLFEGIPLLKFIFKNKKLGGKYSSVMKNLSEENVKALKNIKTGDGKLLEKLGNFIKTANANKAQYSELKGIVKAEYTKEAGEKALKKAQEATIKAGEKAALNPNSKIAEFFANRAVKQESKALQKAEKAAENFTKKAAETGVKEAGQKGIKGFIKSSGAGIMLVFSGAIELLTEVLPTFKELGKEEGMKQLGKSAVKVVGDTAGFIAGEQIGTAIGSAVGSVLFPGVGTAIGAAVGFLGGCLGSFAAGKITKAVIGKTEREKAKEQEENQNLQEILNNDLSIRELKNSVNTKIQEDIANNNGKLTEDAQIAINALNNLESINPFIAA